MLFISLFDSLFSLYLLPEQIPVIERTVYIEALYTNRLRFNIITTAGEMCRKK